MPIQDPVLLPIRFSLQCYKSSSSHHLCSRHSVSPLRPFCGIHSSYPLSSSLITEKKTFSLTLFFHSYLSDKSLSELLCSSGCESLRSLCLDRFENCFNPKLPPKIQTFSYLAPALVQDTFVVYQKSFCFCFRSSDFLYFAPPFYLFEYCDNRAYSYSPL